MTREHFNKKWSDRIKKGFENQGCMIHDESIINYIDHKFEEWDKTYPDFTYSQIKNKFGRLCVYVEGVPEHYSTFENIKL